MANEQTAAEKAAKEKAAKEKTAAAKAAKDAAAKGKSRNVLVEVYKAIVADGIKISPKVDDIRPHQTSVTSVRAIIPRRVADAHPPNRIKIISDAADDAKIGVIETKGD